MPALPPSILEPLWDQFAALLPHQITPIRWAATARASPTGSSLTSSSRSWSSAAAPRDEWITLGLAEQVRLLMLTADDRLFGLDPEHLAMDGCITKAPCGGPTAGPSPVDRRKQSLKRSVAVDAHGVPLGAVAAPANRRDDGLLSGDLIDSFVLG